MRNALGSNLHWMLSHYLYWRKQQSCHIQILRLYDIMQMLLTIIGLRLKTIIVLGLSAGVEQHYSLLSLIYLQDLDIIYHGLHQLPAFSKLRDSALKSLCGMVRYQRCDANDILYWSVWLSVLSLLQGFVRSDRTWPKGHKQQLKKWNWIEEILIQRVADMLSS